MSKKCFWCARESSQSKKIQLQFKGKTEVAEVCSTHCENALRKFVAFADHHTTHYIVGLVLSLVLGLVLTFVRLTVDYGALGVLVIFAGSGFVLILYPFVTPRTVKAMGAKKAIAYGRIVGGVSIGIGLIFWFVLNQI